MYRSHTVSINGQVVASCSLHKIFNPNVRVYVTRTWFLFFRRPLSNRHQYHRPRRLHHKLRLLRPMAARNRYRYLQYDSYDSLTQVRNWTNADGESRQQTHFFHCDQIGIPREMSASIGMYINRSDCRTSTSMTKC